MKDTFADKVRSAMLTRQKAAGEFTAKQIAEDLDLIRRKDKQFLYKTFQGFRKSGEIEKIGDRLHVYRGRVGKPEIRRVMWDVLRAQRKATIEDLIMLAGASKSYARKWLQMLEKKEIVSRRGNRWILIDDPVAMPRNEAHAAYMRRIYEKKKAALAAVDTLVTHVLDLRMAINDIPEE